MTISILSKLPSAVIFGAAALVIGCGGRAESPAPAPAAPAEVAAPQETSPPKEASAPNTDRALTSTCALLSPELLQSLTGLPAKRWKKDLLDAESPELGTCAWKLDGAKPIILTLNVRSNPNPKKRTAWAEKILQKLLAEGRKDKKGTQYPYEAVSGVGDLAAFSQADGQLRWSEGQVLVYTLHTQKPELLTKDQFVAVAQAVSANTRS